MIFSLF
jgi:hypothetical protein